MEFKQSTISENRAQALALEAAGISYQIQNSPAGYSIVVSDSDAEQARAEIEAYVRENVPEFSESRNQSDSRGSGWVGVIGYVAALLLFFALQHQGVFGFAWSRDGKIHAGLIREGQIWRAVTALTLHVDLVHLMSNVIIGGLVGFFAGQVFGAGLAWFCILLSGAAGNLISASFRPVDHTALGASTAVFAGIGLLAAHQWVLRRGTDGSVLAKFAPIIGGVVLLSILGSGGERTDVISHLTGFLAGLLFGTLLGLLGSRVEFRRKGQLALGVAAVLVVSASWAFALGTDSQP